MLNLAFDRMCLVACRPSSERRLRSVCSHIGATTPGLLGRLLRPSIKTPCGQLVPSALHAGMTALHLRSNPTLTSAPRLSLKLLSSSVLNYICERLLARHEVATPKSSKLYLPRVANRHRPTPSSLHQALPSASSVLTCRLAEKSKAPSACTLENKNRMRRK